MVDPVTPDELAELQAKLTVLGQFLPLRIRETRDYAEIHGANSTVDDAPVALSVQPSLIMMLNALPTLLASAEALATLKTALALDETARIRLASIPDAECVSDDDEWDGSPLLGLGWVEKVGERTYGRRVCTVWKITEAGQVARQALDDRP